MLTAAIIITAGLVWLAYEVRNAPVIDELETQDDPLPESIRRALNPETYGEWQ